MSNADDNEDAGYGRSAQSRIYRDALTGTLPQIPLRWDALVQAARHTMSRRAFDYVAGSAGMERTAEANVEAFSRWSIVPRVLRDVSRRDLSVDLFGRQRRTPFLLSPVGVLEAAHPDADAAVARAASTLEVPTMLSTQASQSMEHVAMHAAGGSRWFQLYWSSSRDLVASMVRRAESTGCEAIVVTLDTHILGWRPRDLSLGYLPFSRGRGLAQYTSDPVFRRLVRERVAHPRSAESIRVTPQAVRTLAQISRSMPGRTAANLRSPYPRAAIETFLDVFADSSLRWEDLEFLRDVTTLPILLKGILHPDDARRAIEAGVDGIVVSNHGGRQVDNAIASLDALGGVVSAVSGAVPVIFDSGVRTGADAFIALALGADAVGIGRPYVYGLAVAGEAGVREVIRNLVAELDITMGLAGVTSIAQIGEESLQPRP